MCTGIIFIHITYGLIIPWLLQTVETFRRGHMWHVWAWGRERWELRDSCHDHVHGVADAGLKQKDAHKYSTRYIRGEHSSQNSQAGHKHTCLTIHTCAHKHTSTPLSGRRCRAHLVQGAAAAGRGHQNSRMMTPRSCWWASQWNPFAWRSCGTGCAPGKGVGQIHYI